MNNFPIRVKRTDADKHFTNRGFQKKPDAEVKIFSRGARHYLHPSLSILDGIDCELSYYKIGKIIVVDYDSAEEKVQYTDYAKTVYRKSVMSGEVDFIVNIIRDYINDIRKQEEFDNTSINSVDREPTDITGEMLT